MAENMLISRRGILAMPLFLAACKFDRRIFELSGSTMGTYYKVTAVDVPGHVTQEKIKDGIDSVLTEVNQRLSNWDLNSEISRFNAHRGMQPVTVSPMLAEVIEASALVNRLSLGHFDTTITPLIEMWGFGAKGRSGQKPPQKSVAAAISESGGQTGLELSGNALKKADPQTQVFLSAIGKGYGADLLGRMLKDNGVGDYLIEIGGDLYASGRNPSGQPWQVGVETPNSTSRGILEVVGLSNLGMASSGDYRNYFEQDGVRYSHIIDPISGEPIGHQTASATVLAENGMLADAWATAMLTLGSEKGLQVAADNNIAVMFIDRDVGNEPNRYITKKSDQFLATQA